MTRPTGSKGLALSEVMRGALNEQIKHEFYSSYLYLSMSDYCESINLPGFAHWMRLQSQEEYTHAMKIVDFIQDRGGRVQLLAIDQPPADFASPLDVFQQALEHEREVTGMINDLYGLASDEKDYASQAFLQWFVMEQVEEEKTATQMVDTLKMIGDKGDALIMLDRELAGRTPGGDADRA
jgi:ferritin